MLGSRWRTDFVTSPAFAICCQAFRASFLRPCELFPNAWQQIAYRFRDLHRVCAGPPEHRHNDGCPWCGITTRPEAHVDAFVLHGLLRSGNILQEDRSAAVLPNNQLLILLGRAQLALWLQ